MKVLHIVGGLPSQNKPYYLPFVKSQIESLKKEGIDIEIFEIKGHESIFNYIRAVPKLRRIIRERKINLIHAHYSYSGLIALLSGTHLPVVLSLMGSDLLGRPDFKGKQTLRGRIDIAISHFVSKRVDHLIVKSEEMKKILNLSVPVSVIPNGVDFSFFKPLNSFESRNRLSLSNTDFIILFLGDPKNPRKNFNLAQKSVELLCGETKDNNIQLITPYGIDQKSVLDYINASNVLLMTSYWEGSPNIIKEAMACNLPIISTDVGDVNEIINNTYNCFCVDFSEIEIVAKLKIIKRNLVRSNGRESMRHLEISNIASQIKHIYTTLLKEDFYSSNLIGSLKR